MMREFQIFALVMAWIFTALAALGYLLAFTVDTQADAISMAIGATLMAPLAWATYGVMRCDATDDEKANP